MADEILTLPEVAPLLKVAEKTVYTMVQGRQLSAFKVRGQWRFKRVDIDQWTERQKSAQYQIGSGSTLLPSGVRRRVSRRRDDH